MQKDTCLLCGRAYPAGLHILGCLICFPCEQRLLRGAVPASQRRRLAKICSRAEG